MKILADQIHVELQIASASMAPFEKSETLIPPSQDLLDALYSSYCVWQYSCVTEKAAEITTIESGKYQNFARRI